MSGPTLPHHNELKTTSSPSSDGTSALFDELDELLERMLALPVFPEDEASTTSAVDEAPIAPPPSTETPVGTPMLPVEEVTWTPPTEESQGAESTPESAPEPKPTPRPAPVPVPLPPPTPPVSQPEPEIPIEPVRPVQAPPVSMDLAEVQDTKPESAKSPEFVFPRPRYRLWELPLVGVNKVFDVITSQFGASGEKLQRSSAKTLMGLSGLLMLALAGWLFLQEWL